MENTQLIAILPKLISNSYQQGFIEALELMEKIPPVSYNQAEKMFKENKLMRAWMVEYKNKEKVVHNSKAKNSPIYFNLSDLFRKCSQIESSNFINKID